MTKALNEYLLTKYRNAIRDMQTDTYLVMGKDGHWQPFAAPKLSKLDPEAEG